MSIVALLLAATIAQPPPAPGCALPAAAADLPFGPGEKLEFEIDSMGVRIGSFSLSLGRERGDAPWLVRGKAKTASLASNFHAVDMKVESRMDAALAPRSYAETGSEAGVQRTLDVEFPPKEHLAVRVTRNGERRDHKLTAPAKVRDLVSAVYSVRAVALETGTEVCLPVYGAGKVWTLRAKVAGREPVETPAGTFATIHLEGTATRLDAPGQTREVHLWISDDERRLPVAAFGLVQNKPVRAQLVSLEEGRRVATRARK